MFDFGKGDVCWNEELTLNKLRSQSRVIVEDPIRYD